MWAKKNVDDFGSSICSIFKSLIFFVLVNQNWKKINLKVCHELHKYTTVQKFWFSKAAFLIKSWKEPELLIGI